MDLSTIVITHGHRIATVTLARPEMRNAFNARMIAELTWVFEALGYERNLRAVVLAGLGPAFCAGADLNWMKAMADYTPDRKSVV